VYFNVERYDHKLYWTTSFPPLTCLKTWSRKKSCFGRVRLHRNGRTKDLNRKTARLKRSDIRVRNRGDLTTIVGRDKRDMCFLTNIRDPRREGNYRDEHGKAIKPVILADYNRHMGYFGSADRMANSYNCSCDGCLFLLN
jgi:hypothetical protein